MRTIIFIALAVTVISLIPIKSLEAPLWTVRVVDESNRPVAGVNVRESYQSYSAETEGHESDLPTDDAGRVTFPAQTLRASTLKRLTVMVSSATGGVHASFGSHASVFAFGNGVEGYSVKNGFVEDWRGSPDKVESIILVHPVKPPTN